MLNRFATLAAVGMLVPLGKLRHRDVQRVALRRRDDRQRDARVAARRLDDGAPRDQRARSLGLVCTEPVSVV